MKKVKAALKLAAQRMSLVDASDKRAYGAIIEALAELEQAPALPAPVAWLRKHGIRVVGEIQPQDDSELPLYAVPPAIDDETKRIVLELCDCVYSLGGYLPTMHGLVDQIREKLEANNGY